MPAWDKRKSSLERSWGQQLSGQQLLPATAPNLDTVEQATPAVTAPNAIIQKLLPQKKQDLLEHPMLAEEAGPTENQ